MEQMPVGADRHGGQLTLTEEVAEVLAKLEEHGCFGCPGQRLDHRSLPMEDSSTACFECHARSLKMS